MIFSRIVLVLICVGIFNVEAAQIVSNAVDVQFPPQQSSSQPMVIALTENSPATKAWSRGAACFIYNAHYSSYKKENRGFSTNKCMGVWSGDGTIGIKVTSISVEKNHVLIRAEERFLVYESPSYLRERINDGTSSQDWETLDTGKTYVCVTQECAPPPPWSSRDMYAPSYREQMTNRVEQIEKYEKVTRTLIGYYDADGDGFATATKVGVVRASTGNYLDESTEGDMCVVNDVLVVEYKVPRASFINSIKAPEDGVIRYWSSIKALYQIKLDTTDLLPWWFMPEYL